MQLPDCVGSMQQSQPIHHYTLLHTETIKKSHKLSNCQIWNLINNSRYMAPGISYTLWPMETCPLSCMWSCLCRDVIHYQFYTEWHESSQRLCCSYQYFCNCIPVPGHHPVKSNIQMLVAYTVHIYICLWLCWPVSVPGYQMYDLSKCALTGMTFLGATDRYCWKLKS